MRIKPSLLIILGVSACTAPNDIDANIVNINADAMAIDHAIKGDHILVDKSDRTLTIYKNDREIIRYDDISFGDAPIGHKQFEGDEKTPEGRYFIDARNPRSSYHLSLRISYPNATDIGYAQSQGRSAGGDIFIHGQPNGNSATLSGDWTDGCIALTNAQIEQLWTLIADGTAITIQQ